MLFNSIDFAVFLPLVFCLYWVIGNIKTQNLFIVIASYIFYGWWDARFLWLLLLSSLIDFVLAIQLNRVHGKRQRKILLLLSIISNLGILAFFKYYNFFLDNFIEAFRFFGNPIALNRLDIILPVGISFYTFQTMSYTIDVYRNKMAATKDFIAFAGYVSFFPQLVAGPIERAVHLLPQFLKKRTFEYNSAITGSKQILWGFFKKLVIADNCAVLADPIFDNYSAYPGNMLLLGAFLFTFQIYCDFSGYSDIALGVSRLFGFDLMKNFAYPYFSRDIAEFWRRWHISLSTWFRDYLYIPLGGNKGVFWKRIRNIFLVFLISGFWHGANWTFIIWGLLHAFLFMFLYIQGKSKNHFDIVAKDHFMPSWQELFQMCFTFFSVMLLWIFFRADSLSTAVSIFGKIFSFELLAKSNLEQRGLIFLVCILLVFFILIEWMGRRDSFPIETLFTHRPKLVKWSFYALLVSMIGMFMHTGGSPFIYFQF